MAIDLSDLNAAATKDRMLQVFLTQARGPVRNGDFLRSAVRMALDIQASRRSNSRMNVGDDPLIQTLTAVADALDALGVPYAITGSLASSVHGEPYATLDADIIVISPPGKAQELAARLTPRFYADADMLRQAAQSGTFCIVVDNSTGMKVDLSFITDDPFLHEALRRRVNLPIGSHPREFAFVSAEDVILMKLLGRRQTASSKQWENALGVARVRGTRMDWKYLFEKARQLSIDADLAKLRDEANI